MDANYDEVGAMNRPDDVSFEAEDESGAEESAQAKIKKLREELKEVQARRDEYLAGWQRCKADSVNARREALESADRSHARGKETVAEDLIPVLDSFDMAVGSEAWAGVSEEWRGGMERVRGQLLEVLARHGIERYGAVGERFDHALHEAIQELEDVAGESGEIVRLIRSGYRSASRVIRPAQVIVKA